MISVYYIEKKVRQQPTFPTNVSIIGVRELDFRVRDGNGYCLSTMATGQHHFFSVHLAIRKRYLPAQ